MIINSISFGEIEVDEDKVILFEKGLPGLENLKRFVFLTPDNTYPFYFLHSIDDTNIVLPVINPFNIIKDYNPEVSEDILRELEIVDVEDVLLLNVVVIPKDIKNMTCNLAAPIIINAKNFKGRQVVLDNNKYSIRHPLYIEYLNIKNGGAENACPVQEER